ncbi:MAG: magnesium/cobalt transporter CorA [Candidatus Rifleibacteriota bacterium]
MFRFMKKGVAQTKLGQPPGTLTSFSEKSLKETNFEKVVYNHQNFERELCTGTDEIPATKEKNITWLNFYENSNIELLKSVAEKFELNHLSLEDILNPDHRPKIEYLEDKILLIIKMISINDEGKLIVEQVSFVAGHNYVLCFQEKPGDLFDPIRNRLQNSIGRIRTMESDYLLFALLDIIIDNYFVVLENFAQKLEDLELTLIQDPNNFQLVKLHEIKMQLFFLRKISWPLREITSSLQKTESRLLSSKTRMYFGDIFDHAIRTIDTTETLREVAMGISDLYTTNVSLKMNEIMQTLTIISTIFIPTTFIAGIYGMNFEFMPELKWQWGYFGALGLMLFVALSMLTFFRKKGWL